MKKKEQSHPVRITNLWASQLSVVENPDRRRLIRITIQGELPHVSSKFSVIKIPVEVRTSDGQLVKKAEALDIWREELIRATVDFLLPPGEYRVSSPAAPRVVTVFRFQRGGPLLRLCQHGFARASTTENRVVEDRDGQIICGEQRVETQPCCRQNFPHLDATHAYSVAMFLPVHHAVRVVVEGRECSLRMGHYLVVNPLETVPYADRQQWPMGVRRFILEPSFLRRAREAIGLPKSLGRFGFAPGPRKLGPGLKRAIEEWDRAWGIQGVERRERLEGVFRWILIELLHEHPNALAPLAGGGRKILDVRLQAAVAYLAEHFTESLTDRDVAKAVGMSEVWVRLRFRQVMGVTVKNEVQRLRMERAAHLLQDPSKNVAEVAQVVGYKNVNFFYQLFHTYLRQNPRALRRLSG